MCQQHQRLNLLFVDEFFGNGCDLRGLVLVGLFWSPFFNERELIARIVKHDGKDLKVSSCIDFSELFHGFFLSKEINDVVNSNVPLVIGQMALRKLFSEQVKSGRPHELQA